MFYVLSFKFYRSCNRGFNDDDEQAGAPAMARRCDAWRPRPGRFGRCRLGDYKRQSAGQLAAAGLWLALTTSSSQSAVCQRLSSSQTSCSVRHCCLSVTCRRAHLLY